MSRNLVGRWNSNGIPHCVCASVCPTWEDLSKPLSRSDLLQPGLKSSQVHTVQGRLPCMELLRLNCSFFSTKEEVVKLHTLSTNPDQQGLNISKISCDFAPSSHNYCNSPAQKNNTHTHAHTPKLAPNEPRSSANPLIKKWIEMVDRHFIEYWGTPIYCNNETFDRFQVSELWYCSNIYVFIQHGSNKLECLLGKSSISRYVVLLLFVLLDLTVGNWLRGPQHYSARWMAHIIYINIIFHLFCSVNLHLSVNFRTHVYNVHIYIYNCI